jgi:hypothetical protein
MHWPRCGCRMDICCERSQYAAAGDAVAGDTSTGAEGGVACFANRGFVCSVEWMCSCAKYCGLAQVCRAAAGFCWRELLPL